MLADDHRMLREGLRRSMIDQGFDVVGEAGDGDEAIRLADELHPEVILMDVTMPEVDGVEATRQIRIEHPDIKIVMLTMHADQEVLTSAIRAGASGYLVKDCSTEEIASAVRMAVSGETALSPQLAASDARRGPPARPPAPPRRTASSLVARRRSSSSSPTGAPHPRWPRSCTSARRRSRTTWRRSTRSSTHATAPRPSSRPCAWASSSLD